MKLDISIDDPDRYFRRSNTFVRITDIYIQDNRIMAKLIIVFGAMNQIASASLSLEAIEDWCPCSKEEFEEKLNIVKAKSNG